MRWLWVFCLLAVFPLFAKKAVIPFSHPELQSPWLTGPLITPSASAVPLGHYNIEPYLFAVVNTGRYTEKWKAQKTENFWANSSQTFIQIGLASWLDIDIAPTFYYNYSDGEASWAWGDLPIIFDIQLYHPKNSLESWAPSIKLALRETFPTGKYHRLDPKKKGTDAGGGGAYNTGIGLVFGKLFHLFKTHFLATRFAVQYSLPSAVQLKGFNAYGGGRGTNVRFFPAKNFQLAAAIEATLTQHWVFALDAVGSWSNKTHFSGNPGVDDELRPAELGTGPAVQYSIAPALEYNWNENLGIIFGSWFSVAGRNAPQFSSGIFALNYYV